MEKDFRYDYRKFRPKGISVEQLDMLAEFVFKGNGTDGKIATIIAAVKLTIALAYITARRIMIADEMRMAKQQYEVERTGGRMDDLNRDDLDVRH